MSSLTQLPPAALPLDGTEQAILYQAGVHVRIPAVSLPGSGGGGGGAVTTAGITDAGPTGRAVVQADTPAEGWTALQLADNFVSWADGLDASSLTSGTIDPARLPPGGLTNVVPAGGSIASLTVDEQALIEAGDFVTESDGEIYAYKGSGSKTSAASYVLTGITNVDYSSVQNRPTAVTDPGLVTQAERTKLAGIATAATANSPDATLLARANHTGTQLAATVSDFGTAADARAATLIAAHAALADPHTGYQKESERGAANGYAALDAGTLVPAAQLATGTTDGTKFLRDDRTWQVPAGGVGGSGGPPNTVQTTGAPALTLTSTEQQIGNSGAITPTSTGAKILVVATVTYTKDTGTTNRTFTGLLRRGTTNASPQVGRSHTLNTAIASQALTITLAYIDAPGTVSPTTYSVRGTAGAGVATSYSIVAEEVSATGPQGDTGPASVPTAADIATAVADGTPADGDKVLLEQGGTAITALARTVTSKWLGGLTGEVARPLGAKLLDSVSVKDLGAVGDGTTNDAAAFTAACAAASRVIVPRGTYKLNSQVVIPPGVRLTGDGSDRTILTAAGAAAASFAQGYVLRSSGTYTSLPALSVALTAGANSATFASAPTLSRGDRVVISHNVNGSYSGYRTYYREGFVFTVESVASTVVTFQERSPAAIPAANSVCVKRTRLRTVAEGLSIIAPGGAASAIGALEIADLSGVRLDDVSARESSASLISLWQCDEVLVRDVVADSALGTTDVYALAMIHVQDAQVRGGFFRSPWHGITAGGTGNPTSGYHPNRHVLIDGADIRTTLGQNQALNFHGDSEHYTVTDCHIQGGYALAGNHAVVQGCRVENFSGAPIGYISETKGCDFSVRNCDWTIWGNTATSQGAHDCGVNGDAMNTNCTLGGTYEFRNIRAKWMNAPASARLLSFKPHGATVTWNVLTDGIHETGYVLGTRTYNVYIDIGTGTQCNTFWRGDFQGDADENAYNIVTATKTIDIGNELSGSAVVDPASVATGAATATGTITVTGAALGDRVTGSFSLDLQGLVLFVWVSAANTVSHKFVNLTGGTLNLGSGTLRVWVRKK